MSRRRISKPLVLGIRSIDACLTCGEGQRMGIMAGPGLGKSVLLGMLARDADADVIVVGLVGERGREVREFVERDLGQGLCRSVVVVATGDEPPLVRVRAAMAATAAAEYFRDHGKRVLLLARLAHPGCHGPTGNRTSLRANLPPRAAIPVGVRFAAPLGRARRKRGGSGQHHAMYTALAEGDDSPTRWSMRHAPAWMATSCWPAG